MTVAQTSIQALVCSVTRMIIREGVREERLVLHNQASVLGCCRERRVCMRGSNRHGLLWDRSLDRTGNSVTHCVECHVAIEKLLLMRCFKPVSELSIYMAKSRS